MKSKHLRKVLASCVILFGGLIGTVNATGKLEMLNNMNDTSYDNHDCHSVHYSPGTSEEHDSFDRYYGNRLFSPNGRGSKIVSIIEPNELTNDVRPVDSNTPISLELSLHEKNGNDIILSNHENSLKFSFPVVDWYFGTKPITYWEKDPCDPNYACLIANVRKEILQNSGVVPLEDLDGTYQSEDPYLYAGIRFDVYDSDLNEDGAVDLKDFAIFANNWKRTGITDVNRADINDPGAWADFNLDDKVDMNDLACFNDIWLYDNNSNKFKW